MTCRPPSWVTAVSTIRSPKSLAVTSPLQATARAPIFSMRPIVSFAGASSRSFTTTAAPSRASRSATCWPMPRPDPVTTATLPSSCPIASHLPAVARRLAQQRHLRLRVGELPRHQAVVEVEDIEAPPGRGPAAGLEPADPADEGPGRGLVHEQVLGLEADLAEVAPELGLEGGPDRGLAAAHRAGELLVHRVLGHHGEHAVEVVAIERVGEADRQLAQRRAVEARRGHRGRSIHDLAGARRPRLC